MDVMINVLALANILLAIALIVASMARMDRSYAQRVRAENDRKSILRGEYKN